MPTLTHGDVSTDSIPSLNLDSPHIGDDQQPRSPRQVTSIESLLNREWPQPPKHRRNRDSMITEDGSEPPTALSVLLESLPVGDGSQSHTAEDGLSTELPAGDGPESHSTHNVLNENLHGDGPQLPKTVRRAASFRALGHDLTSSRTSEALHNSIYSAGPFPSQENLALPQETLPKETNDTTKTLYRPSRCFRPERGFTSHSRWPMPQLHSIIERDSDYTLRTSRSLPKISPGPGRVSERVDPETSFHSIHPTCSPWPLQHRLPAAHLSRKRSWSLNDLHCIRRPDSETVGLPHSSSSNETLQRIDRCPRFPTMPDPCFPQRPQTPPGLPSFGTEAATEYRLVGSLSVRSLWDRIWRPSRAISSGEEATASIPRTAASPTLEANHNPAPPAGEIYSDTLQTTGMSRVTSPPPAAFMPSRISLPRGVHTANETGALTRADDGTFVRGRFGPRVSGHGNVHGELEAHPLGQQDESHMIRDAVERIQKACGTADLENRPWNNDNQPGEVSSNTEATHYFVQFPEPVVPRHPRARPVYENDSREDAPFGRHAHTPPPSTPTLGGQETNWIRFPETPMYELIDYAPAWIAPPPMLRRRGSSSEERARERRRVNDEVMDEYQRRQESSWYRSKDAVVDFLWGIWFGLQAFFIACWKWCQRWWWSRH